jgi:uncharacterized flavoprotein (TIGR03862 family)
VASAGGARVTLFDAKASVGRKFLVAGRGGLNLTNTEDAGLFLERYTGPELPRELWTRILASFDANAVRAWADGLGIETFAATTGRVYPREMKAAPLLRRWVRRLRESGVEFRLHHRLTGIERTEEGLRLVFGASTGDTRNVIADAAILALGGGSWPETGSDGTWCPLLERLGLAISPLQPSNCGWEVAWPTDVIARAEGEPLKNVAVRVGNKCVRGELLITRYGLEGGALYALAPLLRLMAEPEISIDFKPESSEEQLLDKLGDPRLRPILEARKHWKLSDGAIAILEHHPNASSFGRPETIAAAVKNCPVQLTKARPLAEAISSAGGVRWPELDDGLMVRRVPGLFVAGEMVDWEAPTGGYLLQGCFATGTHAARAAVAWFADGAA